MTHQANQREMIAAWSLIAIGVLLLAIAIFFDPIGPSPDSGIVDLGAIGTKWLVGCLGGVFVAGGGWGLLRK